MAAHNVEPVIKFLSLHSGLPGPRGNITLVAEADAGYLDQVETWIVRGVKAWRPILRENLGKARIKKKYPDRVAALLALLS